MIELILQQWFPNGAASPPISLADGRQVFYFDENGLPLDRLQLKRTAYVSAEDPLYSHGGEFFPVETNASPVSYGLIAKQNFRKGDLITNNHFKLVPALANLLIRTIENRWRLCTAETHCAARTNILREFYFFDAFMNHSCAPNIFNANAEDHFDLDIDDDYDLALSTSPPSPPPLSAKNKNNMRKYDGSYELRVLRDMQKGEELKSDYDHIEWDCEGDVFECNCGAEKCRRIVSGLRYLPKETQKEFLRAGVLLPHVASQLKMHLLSLRYTCTGHAKMSFSEAAHPFKSIE